MSQKKKPWWAFWQRASKKSPSSKSTDKDFAAPQHFDMALQQQTSELHIHDLPVSHDTLDLPVEQLSWRDGQTTPSASSLDAVQMTREAKIQAARERARQLGRPNPVNVEPEPSSDSSEETEPVTSQEEPSSSQERALGSVAFMSILGVLTSLFSIHCWLTHTPPLRNLYGHLGLLSAFQQRSDPVMLSSFVFQPTYYVGSGGDYILAILGTIIPFTKLVPLVLQGYILMSLFAVLFFLYITDSSIWNACIALFLLFNGVYWEGDLGFLLATPILLASIGSLYIWMTEGIRWAAVATTLAAFSLLLLDAQAYLLFLLAVVCSSVLFSSDLKDACTRWMQGSLSLIAFLPWLFVVQKSPAHPQFDTQQSILSWGNWSQKLGGILSGQSSSITHHSETLALAQIVILFVLAGGALGFIAHVLRGRISSSRALFFPLLSISAILCYIVLPSTWKGHTLSGTSFLAWSFWMSLGWIHLDPQRRGGKLLLSMVLICGLAVSTLYIQHIGEHQSSSKALLKLLDDVPPKSRLTVWNLRTATPHMHQQMIAGLHMLRHSKNIGALRMQGHLRWRCMTHKRPHKATHTLRKHIRGWTHVITTWTPQPSERAFFRLIRQRKKWKLYRVQLP